MGKKQVYRPVPLRGEWVVEPGGWNKQQAQVVASALNERELMRHAKAALRIAKAIIDELPSDATNATMIAEFTREYRKVIST